MTEQWQELKETIIEMRDNDGAGTQQEVCKFLANLMDVLEKQMNDGWIPVSERLPEGLFVKTLVSCEDSLGLPIVPKVALYDGYEHSWECEEKVIAWMHLPKPYKAESEEV